MTSYRPRKHAVIKKVLAIGAGSALALAALGIAGAALFTTPAPPPATADTAKADAYWSDVRATQAAAAASLRVELQKPADGKLRVLFSGDSLSEGWYASAEDKGFRALVAKGLATKIPVETVDTHHAGDRVQDLAARFPIPEDLDLAIVELGTNDVARKTDPALFSQQYSRYLDDLLAKSPKVKVLCLGGWTQVGPLGTAIDKAISEECTGHGGKFLSLKRAYAIPDNRGPEGVKTFRGTSDAFHPNDAGHAAIAQDVLDYITVK